MDKVLQELNNIRKNIDLETLIQLNYGDQLYQVKYLIRNNQATEELISAYEAWRYKG